MLSLEEMKALVIPQIAPCLSVSLYFKSGDLASELAIVACFEDYCRRFGERLRWFAEDDTGRFRDFDDEALEYPRVRAAAAPRRRSLPRDVRWIASGGQHHRDASPWQFYAALRREPRGDPDLNALQASCAIEAIDPDFAAFRDLVREWASTAPALHGYAGLAFNLSCMPGVAQDYQAIVLGLAMRFQGFEVELTSSTAMSAKDGIKGVNWLTVVSHELLARVGGEDVLRSRLSPGIVLWPVRDGVLFQAGPHPEVGDVNRGETLPLYRELSRALRPVRAANHWQYGNELFGAGRQKTDAWLRRFDE